MSRIRPITACAAQLLPGTDTPEHPRADRTLTCNDCDCETTYSALREKRTLTSGKVSYNCPECSAHLNSEFYCKPCNSFHGGRCVLPRHDNGSVAKYTCPDCTGLIRSGEVLDVRQGVYR